MLTEKNKLRIFKQIPTEKPNTPLLDSINSPSDLKTFSIKKLETLSDELREFLLYSVGKSGGHLGGGLGVIELTIIIHHLFDTPYDNLIWDVGHQAYPHKILTGRKNQIETIRKKDGLAPFPSRNESEYDAFGVGHSSTSISALLGMAIGSKESNPNKKHIAVIGDGAMTAGMAFEALSNAGHLKPNILIILNDNDMSIAPAVGALSNYLSNVVSSRPFYNVREIAKQMVNLFPKEIGETAKRAESMDLCFVVDDDYREFLSEFAPEKIKDVSDGNIENEKGETIGKHNGYINYTIGQRRGLGLSLPCLLYTSPSPRDLSTSRMPSSA